MGRGLRRDRVQSVQYSMDDPFVNHAVNCTDNNIMENGDPLESNANDGDYAYTLNGSNLGAPRITSVKSGLDLRNVHRAASARVSNLLCGHGGS